MQVREIMETGVVTLAPEASLEEVIAVLREHDAVPVVNEGGRCVGIITDDDLVLTGDDGELHLPHFFELFGGIVFLEPLGRFEERLRKAVASTAGQLMTENPLSVDADASVHDAARLISKRGHNRLPVTEHGRFVGVVTRLQVLEALAHE